MRVLFDQGRPAPLAQFLDALKKANKGSRPQKQMLFTADGNNDPSWFSRFENDDLSESALLAIVLGYLRRSFIARGKRSR
jgi:hypothetical protein